MRVHLEDSSGILKKWTRSIVNTHSHTNAMVRGRMFYKYKTRIENGNPVRSGEEPSKGEVKE